MEADFFWTPEQERAEKQIFLFKKWYYDKGETTAYAVNMRLFSRRMDKTSRTPKGDRV